MNTKKTDNRTALERTIEQNPIVTGTIWKQILLFFFPILFGTLFQQLYNTVDAVIVGKVLGKAALAAVGGGTSTVINLLIGFFTGLSSGATVIISQFYGAGDREKVSKAVHNAWALAIVGGLIVSVAGFMASDWMLKKIGTPEDIMPMALEYIKIYFGGAVIVVMYNIGSGIFRAFGDSKHPLYFLIAGCLTNIVLDLLFVKVFALGVTGAVYATVASQLLSLLLIIFTMSRRNDSCKLRFRKIRFEGKMLKSTLMIGFPAGIQSIMYSLSNLIIQASINQFGTDTAAAWSAYGKLDCLFWMINNAFGMAITTFVGQNYGAGRIDRCRKGLRQTLTMALSGAGILEVLYMTLGKYGYLLFTDDANVIEIGTFMLNNIAPFYFTFLTIELLSGTIRGTGKAVVPTILTIGGICGLRTLWIKALPLFTGTAITLKQVIMCYPVTWVFTGLLFIAYYKLGGIWKPSRNMES